MIAGRERMYAHGPWIVARAENMHVGGSLMSSYESEIDPVNTELSGQRRECVSSITARLHHAEIARSSFAIEAPVPLLVPDLVAASVCSEKTSSCPNLARPQTALSPSQLVHAIVSVCNSRSVGIREEGMLDRWTARLFC